MTADRAATWLAVAQQTVGHYPPDVLAAACTEARRTVDHPAKIVPAIVKHADREMGRRRAHLAELEERQRPRAIEDRVGAKHVGALIRAIDRGPGAVERVIRDVERGTGA